jgi:hypothetical protein
MTAIANPLDVVQLVTPTCDGRLLKWCDSFDVAVATLWPAAGVDEPRLRRAAHKIDALVLDRGCGLPLIVGHVGDTPDFPPIVGYVDSAVVRPGCNGTPTLYVRERMFPTVVIAGRTWTAAELRRQFPRRSIEFQEPYGIRAVGMLSAGSLPRFALPMHRGLPTSIGSAAQPMALPVESDSL